MLSIISGIASEILYALILCAAAFFVCIALSFKL
jgi:hypothetical protein